MWHSPDSEPLDLAEQGRVFRTQISLGAVKRCATCRELKPVAHFRAYGIDTCARCEVISNARDVPPQLNPEGAYNTCSCGRSKLRHLPHCHDCHLRLTGERRTTAVAV